MDKIDELVASLSQDVKRVKAATHPYLFSLQLIGAGVIYLMVSLGFSGARSDWLTAIQHPWFVAEIVLLFGIFLATSLSAALLGFPDQYQKRKQVFAPMGMFIVFLLILLGSWLAVSSPVLPARHSFECTISISLMSLLPAVWTFYAMRQFATTHYRLAGSVALLSAFSLGALWLRLYENTDSMAHVIEWHYLPMLAIYFGGLGLGKRFLSW